MMHYPLESLKYDPTTEFFYDSGKHKGAYLPNCGVVATSLATGVPYKICAEEYADNKISANKWKGRLRNYEIDNCLVRLGNMHNFRVEKFTAYHKHGIRLVEFAHMHKDTGQSYIIHVSGHYIAIKNGYIGDQYGIFHYNDWKSAHMYGRDSLAKEVWVIENGGVKTAV